MKYFWGGRRYTTGKNVLRLVQGSLVSDSSAYHEYLKATAFVDYLSIYPQPATYRAAVGISNR